MLRGRRHRLESCVYSRSKLSVPSDTRVTRMWARMHAWQASTRSCSLPLSARCPAPPRDSRYPPSPRTRREGATVGPGGVPTCGPELSHGGRRPDRNVLFSGPLTGQFLFCLRPHGAPVRWAFRRWLNRKSVVEFDCNTTGYSRKLFVLVVRALGLMQLSCRSSHAAFRRWNVAVNKRYVNAR